MDKRQSSKGHPKQNEIHSSNKGHTMVRSKKQGSSSRKYPRRKGADIIVVKEGAQTYSLKGKTGNLVVQKTEGGVSRPLRYVEAAGRVEEDGTIRLSAGSVKGFPKGNVRILVIKEERAVPMEDTETAEYLAMLDSNPAYAFLKDPREDIYTAEDGRPYRAEE